MSDLPTKLASLRAKAEQYGGSDSKPTPAVAARAYTSVAVDHIEALVEALERYGFHVKTCPAHLQPFNETPCECGWPAALVAMERDVDEALKEAQDA